MAVADGHLHLKMCILIESGKMHVLRDDFHILIGDDVSPGENTGTLCIDSDSLGGLIFIVQLDCHALEVENQLRNIFLDAGHRGKLMLHTFDVHG